LPPRSPPPPRNRPAGVALWFVFDTLGAIVIVIGIPM
jgi:hypothetical protein